MTAPVAVFSSGNTVLSSNSPPLNQATVSKPTRWAGGRHPRYGPLAVENFLCFRTKSATQPRRRHSGATVECQQLTQGVVVGDVSRPPVGGRDGDIESCVCVLLSAFAASSSRGTGRRGYPGAGSSTHSTHSGGLSHRSRSSTIRREALRDSRPRADSPRSRPGALRASGRPGTGTSRRSCSACSAGRCPSRATCRDAATTARETGCAGCRKSYRRRARSRSADDPDRCVRCTKRTAGASRRSVSRCEVDAGAAVTSC